MGRSGVISRLRRPALVLALLLVTLVSAPRPTAATAAPGTDPAVAELRALRVDVARYPAVTVTVAVPTEVRDQTLGADAFRVTQAGEARPVTVTPVPAAQTSVVLIVDNAAAVSRAALTTQQGAAAELVYQLPSATSLTIATSGDGIVTPPTTDKAATLKALGAITRKGPGDVPGAMTAALAAVGPRAPDRPVDVIVLAAAPTPPAPAPVPLVERASQPGVTVRWPPPTGAATGR